MDLNNNNLTFEYNNITYIMRCVDWYGSDQISFQLSNFLFFIAFLTPHNASNQICDLLFRLIITMGCSIYVIWIISLKEHCFFNYIIFFWPLFLSINFIHSFHLTYRLSPASLPKKFTKLYNSLFEPIKLSKKEFKILTQYSLVINLNKGEHYQVENQSLIDEKVAILLEGKLDVTQNNVFLHHIYPNDFIDSPEFKFVQLYLRKDNLMKQTYPLTTLNNNSNKNDQSELNQTCSNCKQILIEMENNSSINKQQINLSKNKINNTTNCKKINNKNNLNDNKKIKKSKHQKNCAFNNEPTDVKEINNEMNNRLNNKEICLSINSPIKNKLELSPINKLAQTTITANENCKLLCWKRDLLVNDTLNNNPRLKKIFDNLIGQDVIHKLYLVNEEQRKQQQKEIGESQINLKNQKIIDQNLITTNKLFAHNPLRGDNLLNKFREINLFNSFPYLPHDSMIYLNQYNRNFNIGLGGILNQQNLNPYLNYPYLYNQSAIFNPFIIPNSSNDQQNQTNIEINS